MLSEAPGEEAEGTARLARQTGRAAGGVREPASGAERVRQELTPAAGRADRTQLRALLRDGRYATLPSAGAAEHSERQLLHGGAFNLSLILRKLLGGHAAGAEKSR
jgi:hypothetical protein